MDIARLRLTAELIFCIVIAPVLFLLDITPKRLTPLAIYGFTCMYAVTFVNICFMLPFHVLSLGIFAFCCVYTSDRTAGPKLSVTE